MVANLDNSSWKAKYQRKRRKTVLWAQKAQEWGSGRRVAVKLKRNSWVFWFCFYFKGSKHHSKAGRTCKRLSSLTRQHHWHPKHSAKCLTWQTLADKTTKYASEQSMAIPVHSSRPFWQVFGIPHHSFLKSHQPLLCSLCLAIRVMPVCNTEESGFYSSILSAHMSSWDSKNHHQYIYLVLQRISINFYFLWNLLSYCIVIHSSNLFLESTKRYIWKESQHFIPQVQ